MRTGVFCYRNLNRKGVVWSVRSNRTGLVIRRSKLVILKDVTLKVSEAGRKRVIRNKRKNVHAGAVGTLYSGVDFFMDNLANNLEWTKLRYNPYEAGHFVATRGGRKITKADFVILRHDGAWAAGAR